MRCTSTRRRSANLADAARPRRRGARARHRRARLAGRVGRRAGCPSRPSCWPPSRPRLGAAAGGSLDGLKVLVTAGGTREPIDAVRFVGNRSSGKMGWALAEEAARRGARRHASSPPTSRCRARPGIEYVDVATAAELARGLRRALPGRRRAADGRRRRRLPARVGARGQDQEDRGGGDARARARAHRGRPQRARREPAPGPAADRLRGRERRRRARATRGRSASASASTPSWSTTSRARASRFDAPDNEVTIVTADGEQHVPQASKAAVAGAVLDSVLSLRSSSHVRVEH